MFPNVTCLNEFLESHNVYFPPLFHFFDQQMKLHKKTRKLGHFTDKIKQMALSIHFLSPKAYRMLGTIFKLSSVRLLLKTICNWPHQAGLNDSIFEALKFQTQNFTTEDKNCTICLDEMSLKPNLFYNISQDEIIGFGTTSETTCKLAKHVMVVMVQGLYT